MPTIRMALILASTLGALAGLWAMQRDPDFLPAPQACDGSALVALGGGLVLVASDENNVVRLVDLGAAVPEVRAEFDLGPLLRPELNRKGRPKEADLEAAARVGDVIYWIGSHGRDRGGDAEPSRQRLVATRWDSSSRQLLPIGRAATSMLEVLTRGESALASALRAAAAQPHLRGGLDVEGLAATDRRTLLVGFRSPLVDGKALVVEWLNPEPATERGEPATFGPPMWVDLGGRGIRDMAARKDGSVLLLAGPAGTRGDWRLHSWRVGDASATEMPVQLPAGVAWEGVAIDPDTARLWLSADDGDSGRPACKDRPPAERSFRLISR
ncbi:MAG: DUF3616 domain-containing protein [Rhodoferax sp.]|nr:DUF3616 domain-containing protein [Rhodoferax sp.]